MIMLEISTTLLFNLKDFDLIKMIFYDNDFHCIEKWLNKYTFQQKAKCQWSVMIFIKMKNEI